MRGLKLVPNDVFGNLFDVASFTDAWIETGLLTVLGLILDVASFTDAWIETQRMYPLGESK